MKRLIASLLCIIMILSFVGCKKEVQEKQEGTTTLPDVETVAINAGGRKIYLDEAKYYAYTSQATYETYFISEGKEIDWSGKAKGKASWQKVVKSMVLDAICRRECMYSLREEYNVALTDEEKEEVKIKVTNYQESTADAIRKKIQISEKRLEEIYEKALIAQKLEDILNAEQKKQADQIYNQWKKVNKVVGTSAWEEINYKKPIFTLENIDWETETERLGK